MRRLFGSILAVIAVALFAIAPISPANAFPGGIHLHLAGKVGQKAVGSTIIFGAEGLTEAPQAARSGLTPNSCLTLRRSLRAGGPRAYNISPIPSGWKEYCELFGDQSDKAFQIPGSGSFVGHIPLPALPAGEYDLGYFAWPDGGHNGSGTSIALSVSFTVGEDGTFTAFDPACKENLGAGQCLPLQPMPMGD